MFCLPLEAVIYHVGISASFPHRPLRTPWLTSFALCILFSRSRKGRSDILPCAVFAVALFTTTGQHSDRAYCRTRKVAESALTCQTEQNHPVNHQHRPKDGQIENLKPTRQKTAHDHPRRTMPKLKLGQSPDKGPELLILLGGQGAPTLPVRAAVFESFVLRQRRIELGLQECQE